MIGASGLLGSCTRGINSSVGCLFSELEPCYSFFFRCDRSGEGEAGGATVQLTCLGQGGRTDALGGAPDDAPILIGGVFGRVLMPGAT